jgi:hypothetical protein
MTTEFEAGGRTMKHKELDTSRAEAYYADGKRLWRVRWKPDNK